MEKVQIAEAKHHNTWKREGDNTVVASEGSQARQIRQLYGKYAGQPSQGLWTKNQHHRPDKAERNQKPTVAMALAKRR